MAMFLTAPTEADQQRSLQGVESRCILIEHFRLQSGKILPKLSIAYETYGRLDACGRNAILVTHGYMGNHHAAGIYQAGKAPPGINDAERGWWDALIGPGKAIDTDRFFVVSSNMLGSCYGTTNPASIAPDTGQPYGPTFPEITIVDMVAVQHALLTALGIKHLVTVAGWSYGGYLAFQWAVTYPNMVESIVVASSAPKGCGNLQKVEKIRAQLSQDPNWNHGWYYDQDGITATLTHMRSEVLQEYGIEQQMTRQFSDQGRRDKAIRRLAQQWAHHFDGNALIALRRAADFYDAEKDFERIKAKVLYVLATTDKLFPPSIAPHVMGELKRHGVDATYFELDSDQGHLAVSVEAEKWAPVLQQFLAQHPSPAP